VRGTPVRSISQGGYENTAKPAGYTGTVNNQYKGESATPGGGTPYNSGAGNDDQAKSVKQSGGIAMVADHVGVVNNSPESTGSGVLLDGISRESDYTPMAAGAMDSPVPAGSPAIQPGSMRAENIAHLGQGTGAAPSQAGDVLLGIGGVMDR